MIGGFNSNTSILHRNSTKIRKDPVGLFYQLGPISYGRLGVGVYRGKSLVDCCYICLHRVGLNEDVVHDLQNTRTLTTNITKVLDKMLLTRRDHYLLNTIQPKQS